MVNQFIIILASYYIEVGIGPEFLLAEVAAYRPDFVVVAGRDVFFAAFFAQLDLLPADDTIDGVHGEEISKAFSAPLAGDDHAVLEHLLHL